jgi:predicted unusual protein kinase regulating ubiquinone biosynthesis (AarF/ABC1/UbiB family)
MKYNLLTKHSSAKYYFKYCIIGVMLSEKNVDRLVEKLSRMRGAALKMGQMLSIQGIQAANSGQSMLPPQLEQVLLRVHDSANYMPEWQMEVINS